MYIVKQWIFAHTFSSSGQGSQIETSADGLQLVGQRGDGDRTTNESYI